MRGSCLLVAVSLVVTTACEKDSKKQVPWEDVGRPAAIEANRAAAGKLTAPPLFAHIPADTPYVFAAFEPIPDGYWKRICDRLCPALKKLLAVPAADGARDAGPLYAAIIGELDGKLSRKGLAELGLKSDPRWALYALGGLPVARIEVADAGRLKATIERIARRGGIRLPEATIGGQQYWFGGAGDSAIAAGIVGGDFVVTIGRNEAVELALPILFGGAPLGKTMADGARLKEIAGEHGFAGYGVGFIDFEQWIGMTYDEHGGRTSLIARHLYPLGRDPVACKNELDVMTDIVPRVVFGYDEVGAKRASFTAVLELDPSVSKTIASLGAEVPGFTTRIPKGAVGVVGASMDGAAVDAALSSTEAWGRRMDDVCGMRVFTAIYEQLRMIGRLAPVDLESVTGGVAVVLGGDLTGPMPDDVSAYAIIGTRDADALLSSLKGLLGSAGISDLEADGSYRKVKLGPLGTFAKSPVVLAASKETLVLAAGNDARSVADHAVGKIGGPSPLFMIGYDFGKIAKMVDRSMGLALIGSGGRGNLDQLRATREVVRAQERLMGLIVMSAHATGRGFTITVRADLK